MRYIKWIGVISAGLLVFACFNTWVFIESKNITVSGVKAIGTNYGKPGYFHLLMTVFFLALTFIQRIWAKRLNLFITAINLGWAVRNFFIISSCQGGECPDKKSGIYIMLIASIVMLISSMFPDMKVPQQKQDTN